MAADYSDFATGADVQSILTLAGFWPGDTAEIALATEQAGHAAAAARRRFEERTGWEPFLKSDSQTRNFVVSAVKLQLAKVLPLRAGLLELEAVAFNDVAFALTNGGAIAPVLGLPPDAAPRGKPWQALRFPFLREVSGVAGLCKVSVTGRWGYCNSVPEDAWLLSLAWACVEAFTKLNIEQDLAALSEDGFSKQWDVVGSVTPKDLFSEWPKREQEVIAQYRRIPLPGMD